MRRVIATLVLFIFASSLCAEKVVSKEDADHIFSLNLYGWEKYARQIRYPQGWETRLKSTPDGTGVMALDTTTGFGLSIQPMFNSSNSPPEVLIITSLYPAGSVPINDPDFIEKMKRDSENDLGPGYSVVVTSGKMPPYEAVDLFITKSQTSPNQ